MARTMKAMNVPIEATVQNAFCQRKVVFTPAMTSRS